jgi:Macrocin-O-methyltransferase (TylF)
MGTQLKLRLRERLLKWLMAAESPDFENRVQHILSDTLRTEFQSFRTSRRLSLTSECLDYSQQHMACASIVPTERSVLTYALEHVRREGLYLEFGVWGGNSINLIAERISEVIHGFDSFEGLPEDWIEGYEKGAFSTQGQLPPVRDNVQLHVGWFDKVLPTFMQKYTDDIAFMHVDCDLYSSTETIFSCLGDRIKPGCVIVFDEYFNCPNWKENEYKAFQEFVQRKGLKYKYLCYCDRGINAAVIII